MPDNEQDSEDLTTAAARLGLTAETIRKRLQRGKLKGFKTADGTWRVTLDKRQDSLGQSAGQDRTTSRTALDRSGRRRLVRVDCSTKRVRFCAASSRRATGARRSATAP